MPNIINYQLLTSTNNVTIFCHKRSTSSSNSCPWPGGMTWARAAIFYGSDVGGNGHRFMECTGRKDLQNTPCAVVKHHFRGLQWWYSTLFLWCFRGTCSKPWALEVLFGEHFTMKNLVEKKKTNRMILGMTLRLPKPVLVLSWKSQSKDDLLRLLPGQVNFVLYIYIDVNLNIYIYTYVCTYIFIVLACNSNLLHLQLIPGLISNQCIEWGPTIQAHSCSSLGRSNPIVVPEETSFGDWCLPNLDWDYDANIHVGYFCHLHPTPPSHQKEGWKKILTFCVSS